jgi:hypothetical protein
MGWIRVVDASGPRRQSTLPLLATASTRGLSDGMALQLRGQGKPARGQVAASSIKVVPGGWRPTRPEDDFGVWRGGGA